MNGRPTGTAVDCVELLLAVLSPVGTLALTRLLVGDPRPGPEEAPCPRPAGSPA